MSDETMEPANTDCEPDCEPGPEFERVFVGAALGGPPMRPQQSQEVPNDPWAHRSAGMRCLSCMWFVAKAPSVAFGRCRRHAPTMNGYPAVFGPDWCGDHKLNEESAYK